MHGVGLQLWCTRNQVNEGTGTFLIHVVTCKHEDLDERIDVPPPAGRVLVKYGACLVGKILRELVFFWEVEQVVK